jgi:hypothetical protein
MTNVERRHGASDTRPLPRAERRTGAVDTRDSEKPRRSAYRVNYYINGSPASSFVIAYTEVEAADFLGVRDGSAAVSTVCGPIEIAGVDKVHAALPVLEPFKAPPQAPRQFTDAEIVRLRGLLAGKPVTGFAYSGQERRHGAPDTRPLPRAERRTAV